MKVDRRVREAFADQERLNSELKKETDALLKPRLEPRWHYESRVKSLDSFALKVEADQFSGDLIVEDFFACTIVVANSREIEKGVELVEQFYDVQYRRPPNSSETNRKPADFAFDDLRLYVTSKPSADLRVRRWDSVLFEVQVKTYLQHAWGVATHDLTYKSDAVSWGKARIAHEVRAMLEHAELSIDKVESLSSSALVSKKYGEFDRLNLVIDIIRKHWSPMLLPRDLQRLARNTERAIAALSLEVSALDESLNAEAAAGRGALLENLSPYGAIIQTIFNLHPEKVRSPAKKLKGRIVVPSDVEVPKEIGNLDKKYFRMI